MPVLRSKSRAYQLTVSPNDSASRAIGRSRVATALTAAKAEEIAPCITSSRDARSEGGESEWFFSQ